MRIHHLTVRNFRGIVERSVDFDYPWGEVRPLTLLVGPNRSGKTTLLDAIHLVYAVIENARNPAFRPGFDPSDPRLRPNPNRPIEVNLCFSLDAAERAELVRLGTVLGETAEPPPLAERYVLDFAWPPMDPQGVERFGVAGQVPERANLALRGRGKAKVALRRRVVEEDALQRIGGVLYLDQRRSVEMTSTITRTDTAENLANDASAGDILPWMELQARLAARWDPAKGESRWAYLQRVYAALAAPSSIDDVEPFSDGFDLRMRDVRSGRTYYASGTSSGERLMLRLAVNLVAWQAYNSVVLIDEVELHLHPTWQRNLLHFCRQGGGGGNQFIVTTHSEAILGLVDPDSVVELSPLGGD